MADIPYPQTTEGSDRLPKTRHVLKNCFNTGTHILARPGITSLSTVAGVARGAFVWNESLYMVFSSTLYKIATDGSTTTIGTIDGSADIDTAIGFNHAVIVVRATGGKGYTLDSSDTLTEITDTEFEASNSVTHINGRFVYIPFDGDPAFFSDVGDGSSIQTDAFFDAEELPDKNKVTFNWKNFLVIGGTDSFEFFRDQGLVPVPYVRMSMRIDYGYIGGLTKYQDTYAFIGREIDQDVGIYLLTSGSALKISNEYIDSILTTYTEQELSVAIPGRFKWRGHDILCFTLARHSFGYFNGWFVLDTRINNEDLPWRAGFITHYQQKYYTCRSSAVGRLDKINTDYGNPFERLIDTGFYAPDNDDFTAHWVELGISQGYNQQTVVANSLLSDVSNFSAWAAVATPVITSDSTVAPDGTMTADTIEDNSNSIIEYVYQDYTIPDISVPYTFSIYVKKDSTGRATRFPQFNMAFFGSTSEPNTIKLDTSTGESDTSSSSTNVTFEVYDFGPDYWRVIIKGTSTDTANTTLRIDITPASGASPTWSSTAAAQGSIIVWNAELSDTGTYSENGSYLSPIGTVALQLSRDNVVYSTPLFRDTGIEGAYQDKLVWKYPGGLGYYSGFMGVRITCSDDVTFDLDKLSVGI